MKYKGLKEKALVFVLLTIPNWLLANGGGSNQQWKNTLNKIIDFVSSDFMKVIGTIIVICIGFYVLKNLDRLGEIVWKVLGVVLAIIAIINARSISNFFFGS
ncbi:TrbC/VirB2 family protein [Helicobacter cetorum]|uniref:VirB2 type IV secretion protein n=1 Tax=Helicobacter cetorum (strain ATCC BAA-540 / CCUG 52418 / MIT 99-5656) TaxID=1163745 RepID=I0EUF7_HELCM|nr:TrbC/VirB2 family protein [Helicobacter cetorum]AFI06576.1 hypothetical protein HCD_07960 [Helicobacter cetorum MIT 99-5656]